MKLTIQNARGNQWQQAREEVLQFHLAAQRMGQCVELLFTRQPAFCLVIELGLFYGHGSLVGQATSQANVAGVEFGCSLGVIQLDHANCPAMGAHGQSQQALPSVWKMQSPIGQIDFGVVLFKNLTLGAALKYRDGTPFAFLDSFVRNGQRIITYRTIKAENDKGIKGGPRKDYLSDVSVRLAWAFTLFGLPASADAAVFNFLDFGSELSEYVFGSRRYANELQLPRSFRLGLAFSF